MIKQSCAQDCATAPTLSEKLFLTYIYSLLDWNNNKMSSHAAYNNMEDPKWNGSYCSASVEKIIVVAIYSKRSW